MEQKKDDSCTIQKSSFTKITCSFLFIPLLWVHFKDGVFFIGRVGLKQFLKRIFLPSLFPTEDIITWTRDAEFISNIILSYRKTI